ncbi:hypothetical protein LINPERPRIM_LOCUS37008 [Linum perenne]
MMFPSFRNLLFES